MKSWMPIEPRCFCRRATSVFPLIDILLFLQSWEQWLHSVLLPTYSCLLKTRKPTIAPPPPPAPAPEANLKWPKGANCTWKVTGVQCLLPQLSGWVHHQPTMRTTPKDTKTCGWGGWGPWDWKYCWGVETSPTLHHGTAPPHLRQWKVLKKLFKVTMKTLGKTTACKR